MKKRVVVTGLGAITPIGNTVEEFWKNARNGVNGIDFIKGFSTEKNEIKIGGEIKNFDFEAYFGKKELKRMDRFVQLAMVSADEAMKDANFDFEQVNPLRMGVYYGSGIGGLETIANQEDIAQNRGYRRISPFFIPSAIINIAAGQIAIKYGFKGAALSTVTACASATNSIGEAFRAVRDGYLDVCVTGGAEGSLIPLGLGGFNSMKALNKSNDPKRASIPFDKDRTGFVMGEGAGTLVLESYEHAVKRGAKKYAEIGGYGATCDAFHITSPDTEANGAKNCMLMAVEDANLDITDVDYINAHGTSTVLNDVTETLAIKKAFKEHAYKINVSSTKSMTGHLLGASGAIEAIVSILTVKNDVITPTINTLELDEACDLDYTLSVSKERKVDVALSNSLGFGGHNATLLIKKFKEEKMLNSNQIQEIIPHRYPFLLIDKVVELEPGKRAVAIKNVSVNEMHFMGHFPNEHVMPGVLVVEALAQTGAVLILALEENKGKTAYFAGIDSCKFKRKVIPGDQLELEINIVRQKGSIGVGEAVAKVDGEVAVQAVLKFAIG